MPKEPTLPKVSQETMDVIFRDIRSRAPDEETYTQEVDELLARFRDENPVLYENIEKMITGMFPEGDMLQYKALAIAEIVYFSLEYQLQAENLKSQL